MSECKTQPIYQTVSAALIRQIHSGKMKNGDKALSERELAQVWGISRGTARLALQELETLGYLERMGNKGSFIREISAATEKKIVFAFPEQSISHDILNPESWALASDIHRGLIAAASKYDKVFVGFEHFLDHCTGQELKEQLKRLNQYDAAVFIGAQLENLQKAFAMTHPVYILPGTEKSPGWGIPVNYDHDKALDTLLREVRAGNAKTVGVLSLECDSDYRRKRAEKFLAKAIGLGFFAGPDRYFRFSADAGARKQQLQEFFKGSYPDFVFCNNAEIAVEVYEAAIQAGLQIGRDFGIGGISSGYTYHGLIPRFTYVKVDNARMAENIVDAFMRHSNEVPVLELELVKGKSIMEVETSRRIEG